MNLAECKENEILCKDYVSPEMKTIYEVMYSVYTFKGMDDTLRYAWSVPQVAMYSCPVHKQELPFDCPKNFPTNIAIKLHIQLLDVLTDAPWNTIGLKPSFKCIKSQNINRDTLPNKIQYNSNDSRKQQNTDFSPEHVLRPLGFSYSIFIRKQSSVTFVQLLSNKRR
jgi:hypothetical protein